MAYIPTIQELLGVGAFGYRPQAQAQPEEDTFASGTEEARSQELLRILTEPEPTQELPPEQSVGMQRGQTAIAAIADILSGLGEAKGGRPARRAYLREFNQEREQRGMPRSQIEGAWAKSALAGRQRGAAYELGQLEKRREKRETLKTKTEEQRAEQARQERNALVTEAREY